MRYRLHTIEAFLQAVETGSMTHAAAQLNVAKSVVSERIAELEGTLSTQLIHRSVRGITPTDRGVAFYERARGILRELDAAVEQLDEDETALCGRLRVSAPMSFGTMHLAPILCRVLRGHPRLALEFDDRFVDLRAEGFDLAIRVAHQLADSRLVAKRIATSRRVVCCSPEYAERKGLPADLDALRRHEAIGYSISPTRQVWQFEAVEVDGREPVSVSMPCRLVTNNGEAMRDATIAGLGLALLPLFIVAPALKSGQLIEAMPGFRPVPDEIYGVYPHTLYTSRKVLTLLAALGDALTPPPWEYGNEVAAR